MTVKAPDPAAAAGLEGEPVIKVWRTVLDERTRDSHRLADGQARFRDEPFRVGEAALMEPRDPNGPPAETTNCRCLKEVVPLSQLPAEFLPQIIGRLTESEKRFLRQGARMVAAEDEIPTPRPKPAPPTRRIEPSTPPSPDALVLGVGEKGNDVIIFYSDGTEEARSGGTRSWRNHNPGNIVAGVFTDSHGAIGRAGGFAVFPDWATGKAALVSLLNGGVYQSLSLDEAIEKYSPPEGGNPTAQYQEFVREKLKKNGNEPLNTFSAKKMNILANAIIQFEDWQVGNVRYQRLVSP